MTFYRKINFYRKMDFRTEPYLPEKTQVKRKQLCGAAKPWSYESAARCSETTSSEVHHYAYKSNPPRKHTCTPFATAATKLNSNADINGVNLLMPAMTFV